MAVRTFGAQFAEVEVDTGTGEVGAMYGGRDYLASPLNNATQAIGQAGSTFKPFALAAGDRLTVTATRTSPEARATLWLLDDNAETSLAFAETAPRGSGSGVA